MMSEAQPTSRSSGTSTGCSRMGVPGRLAEVKALCRRLPRLAGEAGASRSDAQEGLRWAPAAVMLDRSLTGEGLKLRARKGLGELGWGLKPSCAEGAGEEAGLCAQYARGGRLWVDGRPHSWLRARSPVRKLAPWRSRCRKEGFCHATARHQGLELEQY